VFDVSVTKDGAPDAWRSIVSGIANCPHCCPSGFHFDTLRALIGCGIRQGLSWPVATWPVQESLPSITRLLLRKHPSAIQAYQRADTQTDYRWLLVGWEPASGP
jgi:hypothetical protein